MGDDGDEKERRKLLESLAALKELVYRFAFFVWEVDIWEWIDTVISLNIWKYKSQVRHWEKRVSARKESLTSVTSKRFLLKICVTKRHRYISIEKVSELSCRIQNQPDIDFNESLQQQWRIHHRRLTIDQWWIDCLQRTRLHLPCLLLLQFSLLDSRNLPIDQKCWFQIWIFQQSFRLRIDQARWHWLSIEERIGRTRCEIEVELDDWRPIRE